jgi:hypothetical protein
LTLDFQDDLEATIVRVRYELIPQNVSMLLHGLRLMGVELAGETRSCMLASFERTAVLMDEQSLVNSIQG